jgi:CheY-like chemotaxis protein
VAIEISDTGVGIPADLLPRIFDPFFTANKVGRGTGLGLSISHGTITGLNGTIDVASEVGRGSRFRVILPASPRWRSVRPSSVPRSAPSLIRRVLVVDDDALVAEALARALEGEAEVDVMNDGRQAVERLAAGDRWDVILCDLLMTGLSGMALYGETLRRAPDAAGAFVFMTAGAFTSGSRAFVESMAGRCVEKPIEVERIREIVRRGDPSGQSK